jgi:hypothetical protein
MLSLTICVRCRFYDAYAFHANFLRLLSDNQVKSCTEQKDTPDYTRCTNKANQHATLASDMAWFNGSVPDVTPFPTGPYGGNPGSTDWQTAFPIIAHSLLKHYGATSHDVLTEIWPSLDLFMGYLDRLVEADPESKPTGLLLDGARGDWIPPGGNGVGGKKPPTSNTPTTSIAAFWHTLSVGYMHEIAEAIGRSADAARYSARLISNTKNFHKQFCESTALSLSLAFIAIRLARRCKSRLSIIYYLFIYLFIYHRSNCP